MDTHKSTLPPGWIKPEYSYHEALAIVVWCRYAGPHPASDAKPNRQAARLAAADLKGIERVRERDSRLLAALVKTNITRRTSSWLGPDDRFWPAQPPGATTTPTTTKVRYYLREDLARLCPGAFPVDEPQPGSELRPLPRRVRALRLAIAEMQQADPGIDPFALEERREDIHARCYRIDPGIGSFDTWAKEFWQSPERKTICGLSKSRTKGGRPKQT